MHDDDEDGVEWRIGDVLGTTYPGGCVNLMTYGSPTLSRLDVVELVRCLSK